MLCFTRIFHSTLLETNSWMDGAIFINHSVKLVKTSRKSNKIIFVAIQINDCQNQLFD